MTCSATSRRLPRGSVRITRRASLALQRYSPAPVRVGGLLPLKRGLLTVVGSHHPSPRRPWNRQRVTGEPHPGARGAAMTSVQPTLSQALGDYLALRRARYARATVQNESFVLRRFIASVGDIQVRHVRPEHVEAFFYGQNGVMATHRTRDGLTRSPVWSSTHNYYRSRLKSFFAYCTQRGLTRAVLLAPVTPMKVEVRNRLQPGPEMLWTMLEGETCPRDRAILAVAMNTGLDRRPSPTSKSAMLTPQHPHRERAGTEVSPRGSDADNRRPGQRVATVAGRVPQ